MFDIVRKEIMWAGRPLVLETGKIARQADGAVMATYGGTTVLCTVVGESKPRPGLDFFPLSVHYQEKTYAAGKIPGGFFKREARPSEKEVLTSRLIDRPIRPLFVKGYKNETQVICTVMAHDMENDPDMVALVGASAALTISGLPFLGPIGGVRVGEIEGELTLNPTLDQMKGTTLDLIVAGTQEGVLMVESEAQELSEDRMLEAVMFAHRGFQPVIDMIIDMAEEAAKEPREIAGESADVAVVRTRLKELASDSLRAAYAIQAKAERQNGLAAAKEAAMAAIVAEDLSKEIAGGLFKELEGDIVRGSILETGQRIDGRTTVDVRQIVSEVGVLPRSHGSALFTRGETQTIATATLGTRDRRASCRERV